MKLKVSLFLSFALSLFPRLLTRFSKNDKSEPSVKSNQLKSTIIYPALSYRDAIKGNYGPSYSCHRSRDTICIVNYFYYRTTRQNRYFSDVCNAVMRLGHTCSMENRCMGLCFWVVSDFSLVRRRMVPRYRYRRP